MKKTFLEFEHPIAALDTKIEELRHVQSGSPIDINNEIDQLQQKVEILTKKIYSNLTPWQIVQVARHIARPKTLDYIQGLFDDFSELHGDRHFADDKSIIGGIARFEGNPVMVIGHQKGRNTKENLERNFGMPRPEGYRKALRLMHLAEKFKMPVITFVDTNGAYPGIGAEERNQSEAIGKNLYDMAILETPIITTVIGEGGSGGALAIAVGDQINMLEYAIYSVITPEGCASILWKNAARAADAAKILGITAKQLKSLDLIDAIIKEPLGGAHTNHEEMFSNLRKALKLNLKKLKSLPMDELLNRRLDRLMQCGKFEILPADSQTDHQRSVNSKETSSDNENK